MKPALALARASRAGPSTRLSVRALSSAPVRSLASPSPLTPASRPTLISTLSPSPSTPATATAARAANAAFARTFFSLPDISKLANLVPGAATEGTVETDGEEQRFHARKILPFSPAQLYELVSDVPAYANFIPFCTSSTVLDAQGYPTTWKPGPEPFTVYAELAVGFGGLEERYVSKVIGTPFERVSATASKRTPLFKNLVTTWSFAPAAAGGNMAPSTMLTIDLTFAFANPLHRIASQAVLPKVADKMVEAFETRAHEVYGARS